MPKASAMNQILSEGTPHGTNSANQSQQKIKTSQNRTGIANGPLIQAPKQQMAFTSYETGFGHNSGVGIGKSSRNNGEGGIGVGGNSRNAGLAGNGNLMKSH